MRLTVLSFLLVAVTLAGCAADAGRDKPRDMTTQQPTPTPPPPVGRTSR
jgi:hypothetical protein